MNQTKINKEESVSISGTGKKTIEVYSRKNLHYLILKVSKTGTLASVAQMKAQITDVTVRFNGKAFHEVDATFLLDLERYYKDAVVSGGNGNIAGYIVIPFVRQDLASAVARFATSVGVKGITSITVDVEIAAVTNIDLIEIFAVYDDAPARPMGVTRRLSRHTASFATTGEEQVTNLPKSEKEVIGWLAAHIKYASGTLDKISLKKDSVEEFNEVPPAVFQSLAQDNRRTFQSGYTHIDFAKDRDPLIYLEMPAESLVVKNTWSSAAPDDYFWYLERLFADPAQK